MAQGGTQVVGGGTRWEEMGGDGRRWNKVAHFGPFGFQSAHFGTKKLPKSLDCLLYRKQLYLQSRRGPTVDCYKDFVFIRIFLFCIEPFF